MLEGTILLPNTERTTLINCERQAGPFHSIAEDRKDRCSTAQDRKEHSINCRRQQGPPRLTAWNRKDHPPQLFKTERTILFCCIRHKGPSYSTTRDRQDQSIRLCQTERVTFQLHKLASSLYHLFSTVHCFTLSQAFCCSTLRSKNNLSPGTQVTETLSHTIKMKEVVGGALVGRSSSFCHVGIVGCSRISSVCAGVLVVCSLTQCQTTCGAWCVLFQPWPQARAVGQHSGQS